LEEIFEAKPNCGGAQTLTSRSIQNSGFRAGICVLFPHGKTQPIEGIIPDAKEFEPALRHRGRLPQEEEAGNLLHYRQVRQESYLISAFLMGFIFKDADAPESPKAERMYAMLFSLIIAILGGIGILALVLLLHDEVGSGFRMPRQMAMGLLSAAIVCGGLIMLLLGVRAKKEALKMNAALNETDEKPWLKRKDWATGRIGSSSRKASLLLWIIVVFWFAVSAGISLVVPVPQHSTAIRSGLVALILMTWLAVIYFAARTTSTWRRFGKSIFEMDALPAALGGVLKGEIHIRGKLRPEQGWFLAVSCIRRSTIGPTNNLRTTEKILWRDEKWLRSDLPQTNSDTTAVPVFFQLPGDKPQSTLAMGDGTHWRLEAWARLRGPDFAAAFEVPVFKLEEPPEAAEDLAAPYQVSLDEIRKQIHSKIQIADLPNGKEFIFPAGRNPGFAAGATILCAVWTAMTLLLFWMRAPLPVPLVFGAMDLLMLSFVLDLWLRSSRTVISGETIKMETSWSGFKTENSIKVSDAVNFLAEAGATVGYTTYYDLKLQARDGKELTLAKNLGHKPEADWLARQMTIAARNISTTNAPLESKNQKSPAAKK
jgi:hypothetical protein